MDDEPAFAPVEFVTEENLNFEKDASVDEGVESDNETVKSSNLPAPPNGELPSQAIRCGPLTYDPSPPTEEGEDVHLATANDQAELMRWHYRLGHLTFAKLKQLTLNGEIPKKLAKITPPKCAGCLFGVMTKAKKPRPLMRSLSQPSQGSASPSIKWHQPRLDSSRK